MTDLPSVRSFRARYWAPLALALAMLAPFGPRPVVAGAAALLGDAVDDHAHRVSVRTSGVCSDVVIEHDAEAELGAAKQAGAGHEHREICLSRDADALLSKLTAGEAASAGAFGLELAEIPALTFSAVRLGVPPPDRSPPGLRALRTVVLIV